MTDLKKMASLKELLMMGVAVFFILIMFNRIVYAPKNLQLAGYKTELVELNKRKKSLETELLALKAKQIIRQVSAEKSTNVKIQILKGDIKPVLTDATDMINLLTRFAGEERIVLDKISSKDPEIKSGYAKIPFVMGMHGSFSELMEFLKKLDNVRALFAMDALILATDTTISSDTSLDIKATLYDVEGIHAEN